MYWFSNLLNFSVSSIAEAQNVSGSPSSPSEQPVNTELLLKQIEALQKTSDSFANSFDSYTRALDNEVSAILMLIAFVGGIAAALFALFQFLFGKNLSEAQKNYSAMVERSLEEVATNAERTAREEADRLIQEIIPQKVNERVESLAKTLQLEEAISRTSVVYVLENKKSSKANSKALPIEYEMLAGRGFQIEHRSRLKVEKLGDRSIVVLDLVNLDETEENDAKLRKAATDFPDTAILIVYHSQWSQEIENLKKGKLKVKYYNITQNRVSLMGAVVDAAHVARTL